MSALKRSLAEGLWVGVDVESTGPNICHPRKPKQCKPDSLRHKLVGVGFAVGDDSWYVPLRHDGQDPNPYGWKVLRFVERWDANLVMHNSTFDLQVLLNEGYKQHDLSTLYDSMLILYVAGWRLPGAGGLKLKPQMEARYRVKRPDYKAVTQGRLVNECSIEEVAPYCAADAADALRLATDAWASLHPSEKSYYRRVERPVIPVTMHMHQTGTALTPGLKDGATFARDKMQVLAAEFEELTRCNIALPVKVRRPKRCAVFDPTTGQHSSVCTVPGCVAGILHYKNGKPKKETVTEEQLTVQGANIASSKSLVRWLFHELGWWPIHGHKLTKKKQLSTKAEAIKPLMALAGPAGQAARLRAQYQALSKYADLYTSTLVDLASQWGDGRLHTDYKQTGTDTSRYSSSFPNISNLPRNPKAEGVPDIRAYFVGREEWKIVQRDYSQGELRLAAHYSQDPSMLRIYREDGDIHAETMAGAGVDRPNAKIMNFSNIYDISAKSLAAKIAFATGQPCSVEEAADRQERFFDKYARIKVYQDAAERYARNHGYARNMFGFRMRITDWSGKGRGYSRRKAINYPIQGTLGGMMKLALIGVYDLWEEQGVLNERVAIQGQTYDSMYVEARPDFVEQAGEDMRVIMENVIKLSVPVKTDLKIGASWSG